MEPSTYNPWATPIFPGASAFGVGSPAETAERQPTIVDNLLSHIAGALGRGFMAPGQALQSTTPITSEQMIAPAQDMSTMMSTGSGAFPGSANELRMGIKAYHGSPHDFDAFDLSKIGTGEGAQAYGHGLYFADNEGVARSYREALAPGYEMRAGGKEYNSSDPAHLAAHHMDMFGKRGMERPEIAARLREDAFLGDRYTKAADLIDSGAALPEFTRVPSGKMYEVNINAEPEHFLDWDKPLNQQPAIAEKVQRKFSELGHPDKVTEAYSSGGDFVRDFSDLYSPQTAIGHLSQSGIPGIKYLDQGSRPPSAAELSKAKSVLAGAEMNGDPAWIAKQQANVARLEALMTKPPTSNYVVFNDKLIDIMRKYAIPGMLGAPIFANAIGENKQ